MADINKDKYCNTILYLISRMPDKKIHGRKKLAKLLYYVDFDRFEYQESMQSVTGDTYIHKMKGPYPNKMNTVIEYMKHHGLLEENDVNEYGENYRPTLVYSSSEEPDLSSFDDDDKYILNRVAEKYRRYNGEDLAEKSHGEAPWLSVDDGEVIPYEMAFYRGTFD